VKSEIGAKPGVNVVSISEKLGRFQEHWQPKIVGELNESYVKLVKLHGEFVIIPLGVEPLPVAEEEVHVLPFEPKSTLNTGNVSNERTVPKLERI